MSAKSKKKKNKRRRQRRITFCLLLLLVVVGVGLSMTVFFNITDVVVEGAERYTAEQIRMAADIAPGQNLFRFSARERERQLWLLLPYVEEVSIHRRLPGTVIIQVTETESLLCIPCESGYAIVSSKLKILEVTSAPPPNMISVIGLEPVAPKAGEALEVQNVEAADFLQTLLGLLEQAELLRKVTEIDVTDKLNYTLVYDNRIAVMIGTANKLDVKISMLRQVVIDELTPQESGFLDISIASKAIYKQGDIHAETNAGEDIQPELDDPASESESDEEEP